MREREVHWKQLNDDAVPLWAAYKADPSQENRNELVSHYVPFARFVALQRRQKLATDIQTDIDDLIANASMALIDAVARFDPDRGTAFTSYAMMRLSGAITDGIRQMDWVPRLERTAQRDGKVNPVGIGSLDAIRQSSGKDESGQTLFDVVEVRGRSDRKRRCEDDEFWAEAAKGFNKSEKLILWMYYQENMTFKEIGRSLGLSESRISQMHSGIIARFREKAKKDGNTHTQRGRAGAHRSGVQALRGTSRENGEGTRNQPQNALQPAGGVRNKKRIPAKEKGVSPGRQDRAVPATKGKRLDKRVDRKTDRGVAKKSKGLPQKRKAVRPRGTR